MKKVELFLVGAMIILLSGCQIIGDIFKAGVGVGVFIVIAIIALLIFIVARIGGK